MKMDAYFYTHPDAGFLEIGGPHQVDFLQRQTTNDVKSLSKGRALWTVFTSPTARILDVCYLVSLESSSPDEKSIGVITLPGRSAATAAYLKSRIFFMDRVTVQDASLEYVQIDLFGAEAAASLAALGLSAPPSPGELAQASPGGRQLLVFAHQPGGGLGFRLIAWQSESEALSASLSEAGAHPASFPQYEIRRIEAGLPGPRGELNAEYTPLEVNLQAAISDRKGCYTGQEIIARQLTYDKVTRRLVGLRPERPVGVGSPVLAEGKPAGIVTSAAVSAAHGPLALAVLRRPYHVPGTRVAVTGEEGETAATVTALPF